MSNQPLSKVPGTYEDEGVRIYFQPTRQYVALVVSSALPFADPRHPDALHVDRVYDQGRNVMWCSQSFYDYAKSLCVYSKDLAQ